MLHLYQRKVITVTKLIKQGAQTLIKRNQIMTTTVNNSNESKVVVNQIDFSGSFYKFLGENIKIGNQILYPGNYKFDYLIKLDDGYKNGHLTFSFTGSIKIKKGNGRYYDYISGAIGNIIICFSPELSMFEKLHLCNHVGQPTYIDNIRYSINTGKTNKQIAEMYNISNLEAIEILRNASDNKDLFHYLVFHLGVADAWEKQAKEAIREMEAKTGLTLKIENKDKVYKQFDAEKCNDMAYLFKHGYATKEMKQAREETARTKKRLEELAEIEKEFAKSVEKAKRIYEVKKAVVSFGISWDNVTLYDHRNELCFNWLDCCKKVPSDLINELVCSNTLPEGIKVTNLDKGRE